MPTESEQRMAMQDQRLKENMGRIQHKILVMSGKGGVGKTTVAVNVAYQLALTGKHVGILDVDIHGPNIAKMLGIEEKKIFEFDHYIEPVFVMPNLKAVSISMFSENMDQPFIWRGPRKMAAIKQFLSDVNWGELDYLIIDSPPGTGDEPLSVCQLIPDIDGAVIVTTPQDVAVLDSRKSIMFSRALEIPVLGIIENMSGFLCPHCQKAVALFGQGGGEKAAHELRVPFLGNIPIDPQVVVQGDTGRPFVQSDTHTASVLAIKEIINRVTNQMKRKRELR